MNQRDYIDEEVFAERMRQDQKWGEQNYKDGTGSDFITAAHMAKKICEEAHKAGILTWHDILREEFFEAISESDPSKLKTELIQIAAVCKAWIQCIDRRNKKVN